MKFLTFSDLHENEKILKKLLERASQKDIELVITAGDLTIFGKSLSSVLKSLNNLNKKVYLIPGNHESDTMINEVIANYPNCINFNKSAVKVGDYLLIGYGGDGFSKEDAEFRTISRGWYSQYQNKKIIFVTHGPPADTKVDLLEGKHVGNLDYRKFIERINPKLVICGHLHETAGQVDKINDTNVINPGTEGMVIEIN